MSFEFDRFCHSSVNSPRNAAASTDFRYCSSIAGTASSASRAARERDNNSSSFATMRRCSVSGGMGIGAAFKSAPEMPTCPAADLAL